MSKSFFFNYYKILLSLSFVSDLFQPAANGVKKEVIKSESKKSPKAEPSDAPAKAMGKAKAKGRAAKGPMPSPSDSEDGEEGAGKKKKTTKAAIADTEVGFCYLFDYSIVRNKRSSSQCR